MDTILESQLKNAEEIKSILKQLPMSFKLVDGRDVDTLLVYLPSNNDGESYFYDFFECVKNGILQNFVFSCTEVKNKLNVESQTACEDLFQKALRKISKHTAKGELGELILFTLLDVYLNAPKLLSKVSMKTNPRMPVYGADAVHGQVVNGEFRIYLGESKLYSNFSNAAITATKSIKSAKDKYEDEFDLLDSYMDFPNLDEKLLNQIIQLLNPYISSESTNRIHSPCFIGFTQPEIIFKDEKKYLEEYGKIAKKYILDFYSKVETQGISIDEVTLLMLPFSCVDELVDEFIAHVGISK